MGGGWLPWMMMRGYDPDVWARAPSGSKPGVVGAAGSLGTTEERLVVLGEVRRETLSADALTRRDAGRTAIGSIA